MNYANAIATGIDAAAAEMGEDFTIDGHDGIQYRGVFSDIRAEYQLAAGGYRESIEATVSVKRSLLPIPPRVTDRLVRGGRKYVVRGIDATQFAYTLGLKSVNQ